MHLSSAILLIFLAEVRLIDNNVLFKHAEINLHMAVYN